jgi:hypothetical protein
MQLLACLSLAFSAVTAFPTAEYLAKLNPSVKEVEDVLKRYQNEKRIFSWKPIEGESAATRTLDEHAQGVVLTMVEQ